MAKDKKGPNENANERAHVNAAGKALKDTKEDKVKDAGPALNTVKIENNCEYPITLTLGTGETIVVEADEDTSVALSSGSSLNVLLSAGSSPDVSSS